MVRLLAKARLAKVDKQLPACWPYDAQLVEEARMGLSSAWPTSAIVAVDLSSIHWILNRDPENPRNTIGKPEET